MLARCNVACNPRFNVGKLKDCTFYAKVIRSHILNGDSVTGNKYKEATFYLHINILTTVMCFLLFFLKHDVCPINPFSLTNWQKRKIFLNIIIMGLYYNKLWYPYSFLSVRCVYRVWFSIGKLHNEKFIQIWIYFIPNE